MIIVRNYGGIICAALSRDKFPHGDNKVYCIISYRRTQVQIILLSTIVSQQHWLFIMQAVSERVAWSNEINICSLMLRVPGYPRGHRVHLYFKYHPEVWKCFFMEEGKTWHIPPSSITAPHCRRAGCKTWAGTLWCALSSAGIQTSACSTKKYCVCSLARVWLTSVLSLGSRSSNVLRRKMQKEHCVAGCPWWTDTNTTKEAESTRTGTSHFAKETIVFSFQCAALRRP